LIDLSFESTSYYKIRNTVTIENRTLYGPTAAVIPVFTTGILLSQNGVTTVQLTFLLFWCVSTTYDGRQDFLIFLKPDKLFYRIEFHIMQYLGNMLYMNLWYCMVWNSILMICWLCNLSFSFITKSCWDLNSNPGRLDESQVCYPLSYENLLLMAKQNFDFILFLSFVIILE